MKTKEDAAKLLLENGWTLDEVNQVLGKTSIDFHYHYSTIPYWSVIPPLEPVYRRFDITMEEDGSTTTPTTRIPGAAAA